MHIRAHVRVDPKSFRFRCTFLSWASRHSCPWLLRPASQCRGSRQSKLALVAIAWPVHGQAGDGTVSGLNFLARVFATSLSFEVSTGAGGEGDIGEVVLRLHRLGFFQSRYTGPGEAVAAASRTLAASFTQALPAEGVRARVLSGSPASACPVSNGSSDFSAGLMTLLHSCPAVIRRQRRAEALGSSSSFSGSQAQGSSMPTQVL